MVRHASWWSTPESEVSSIDMTVIQKLWVNSRSAIGKEFSRSLCNLCSDGLFMLLLRSQKISPVKSHVAKTRLGH